MVCSVFLITGFTFVVLNGTFDSVNASAIQALLGFVGFGCVVRVYGKVVVAERVTNEVRGQQYNTTGQLASYSIFAHNIYAALAL